MSIMWSYVVAGRTAHFTSVDDCLGLLRTIIARRIKDKAREQNAIKRNHSPMSGDGNRFGSIETFVADDIDLFDSGVPAADAQAIFKDELQWFLSLLSPELRGIANSRVNGTTVEEIAKFNGTSTRTIERRLAESPGDLGRRSKGSLNEMPVV